MSNLAMMMGLGSAAGGGGFGFVGFANEISQNGGSVTVDLSSIDIKAGDLIIGAHLVGEDADRRSSMSLTSTGYTLMTEGYASDTYDAQGEIYGKIADGTETSFVTASLGVASASVVVLVGVFRGVSETIPTNGSTGIEQSGTLTNTDDVNWSNITGLTSDNILVYIAASGHVAGQPLYDTPSDLDGFQTRAESDDEDVTGGMGYKIITSETSFDAETWTVSANGTASSVFYVTIKLTKA